ncbi:hypothetical protein GGD66_005681 [Bradyrhizobium sp. CIR48]|uniref:hypothetical protein n=1 Tax=Bradyrhizobium sp. CIR48 TaxID=2663840 RepID=UPI001605AF9C|nr:hypothetical protein [Bradyrhizobium sp. CIR48]MBB4427105.1 hypothetical protein [Bradyrhizobium sp. CIR48]
MKRWHNLNNAFQYLLRFIEAKLPADRYNLSEIDLALVSNFKGGNASIVEPIELLSDKLAIYGRSLDILARMIGGRALVTFSTCDELRAEAGAFLALTLTPETAISGFRASYASALLAAYFPETLPVLDRQVLRGAGIAHKLNSQGQVIQIEQHYGKLIERFHSVLKSKPGLSLRELDREWFAVGSKENSARIAAQGRAKLKTKSAEGKLRRPFFKGLREDS